MIFSAGKTSVSESALDPYPDPVFYLNVDPDPNSGSKTNVDPDPDRVQTLPSQKFYFTQKYTPTLCIVGNMS